MSKEERFNLLYQKIVEKYNYIDNNRKMAKDYLAQLTQDLIWMTLLLIVGMIIVVGGNKIIAYFLFEKFIFMMSLTSLGMLISLFFISKEFIRRLIRRSPAGITYYKDYKRKVINEMIKSFNKNVQYYHYLGLDMQDYIAGEFENLFNRYHSEDLIIGILENDKKISIGEVRTYIKYDDTYISAYKGIVAKIEIRKKINSKIYIKKDSKNIIKTKEINIQKVELDSQEFENLFNIYSDNKIIAMQILTSDVMNMLIDFYKEIPFEITIKNNNIYIRFHTGEENLFENPSLYKEALDRDTLYKYYSILDFTFELINKIQDVINKVNI